jgi:CubicO group peptidase (beta-lactamase class C family)
MKLHRGSRATTRRLPGLGPWGGLTSALLAATALALLATGCGASSSSSDPGGSDPGSTGTGGNASPAAQYVGCMREHGVANFPDPVEGRLQLRPDSGVDPNSAAFKAAETACKSLAPQATSGADGSSPRDWSAFAGWLRQRAAAGDYSGVVLVTKDGRPILTQADGLANRARQAPNAPGTRFNVGSIGKVFTAVAIAELAQQGRVSFHDPISQYLPGLPGGIGDKITIADLLTHTSGLGDVFQRWHPTASPLSVSQLLRKVANQPLQFEPGSRFSYSNSGFVVLGAIIEAVTGGNYYHWVRTHVFAPAGMTHSGWYALDQVPNMAHGYLPARQAGKPVAFQDAHGAGGAGNPSGGAYSTVGDLLRFAQALLGHKLLSAAMTDTVLSGKVDTGRPGLAQVSRYGYGFEDDGRDGVRIVGHGGGAPGIEAQLRIFPKLGYTVVVLANQDAAATPVYDQLLRGPLAYK